MEWWKGGPVGADGGVDAGNGEGGTPVRRVVVVVRVGLKMDR